ncbi:MAG: glycoside hydrolase family 13 protein [Thermosynechococcaceae cyanobacterium]
MDIQTPTWVKHAVFYQIFPDRFAKGSKVAEHRWTAVWEDWHSPPTSQGYKGGDLWGVIEKLDYLKELGITALYFTPIFQSACNHRYHTHDYYQVDPILGGNVAFKALLNAAHDRQLKVVLDGVFNHASRGFYFFNDILENGPHSPWVDWFRIDGWPLSAYDGSLPANYQSWIDNRALPTFNHDNPQVREYIMQVGEYWINFGIDGWRLDVPFEVKIPGFWQEFRDRIKAINPEAYIVGEVWQDARQWLDGTQFDGVMNYLFTGPTLAFTGGDRIERQHVEAPDYTAVPALSAAEYGHKIQELLILYPWEIQLTQLNSLASHDTARLLTIAGGDRNTVELATLLQFTFPGAPCIYYGDEVGLPGGLDPDSRRSFPEPADWDHELLGQHRQLIALRHRYPALRTGRYQLLKAERNVYVFARILGANVLVIAVNAGQDAATTTVGTKPLGEGMRPDLLVYGQAQWDWTKDEQAEWAEKKLVLQIPARSGCILAADSS